MQPQRRARVQAVIQEEISRFISREVKDPRIPSVTVTQVQVTPDAGQATVFITILGAIAQGDLSEKEEAAKREQMKECLKGLNSAAGFMRRHLAKVLTVRHVPSLVFKEDRGFENTTRVHELLKKIGSSPSGSSGGTDSGGTASGTSG